MSQSPNNLLKEFPSSTYDEWFNQATKELERLGKDAEGILKGKINAGIEPYLTQENNSTNHPPILVNRYQVGIHADFTGYQKDELNAHLLKSLILGVNSIEIDCDIHTNIDTILEDILPDGVEIQWNTDTHPECIASLIRGLSEHYKSITSLRGCIPNDFIGNILKKGFEDDLSDSLKDEWLNNFKLIAHKLPHYKAISISGNIYLEAGADTDSELSYILSHLSEYFVLAKEASLDMNSFASRIQIEVGLGVDYFLNIAKLRAIRVLWSNLLKAYGCDPSIEVSIFAKTALRFLSAYDAQLNILRCTTAAMSGIIGGSNKLYIAPFDITLENQSQFSLRIARNLHHLLKEESYLEFNNDPSAGSYLIERITDQLIADAWKKFQQIESNGGLLKLIGNNELQESLAAHSKQEEDSVKKGDHVILGVNKHPSSTEDQENVKMMLRNEENVSNQDHYNIKPLRMVRLAAVLEKN